MKKRLMISVGVVLLAIAVVAAVAFWPEPKEPEYQGKKLSEWLNAYAKAAYQGIEEQNARKAVLAIGTNGLPYYLAWLRGADDDGSVLRPATSFLMRSRAGSFVLGFFSSGPAWRRKMYALHAFSFLQERAAGAIPELVEMMKQTNTVHDATACLGAIGPPALGSLIAALERRDQPDRATIAMYVGAIGAKSRAQQAATALILCVDDSDPDVASAAARWLGGFPAEAQKSVPTLTRALQSTNLLLAREATNALMKIAPEVLTNGVSAHR